jgi:chemotaxis protein histidine kinase CheA
MGTNMGTNDIEVRPKFQGLIPKLARHELEKLEASILAEGVRDPLTIAVFEETNVHGVEETVHVLLDGHHRHDIAMKHGLPFPTREVEFEDEDAAIIWMIDYQLGRRNIIHPLDRVILLEKKRPILEKQAQVRMLAGKTDDGDPAPGTEQGKKKHRAPTVLEQLAKEAGIGRTSYEDCLLILKKGIPALIKFVREGDLSVTGAAKLLNHTPPGRHGMTDEEHRAWQQELADNVKGDADAMQAVIRKINWNHRDYQRMCDRERAAEAEAKKKEEDFQAREKQDEEEITKWREEQEAPEDEEEQTETPEAEEVQEAPEEEQEAEEQEAPAEEEEEKEQEAPEKEQTITEIHQKIRQERQEVVADLVTAIVNATAGILTSRGLGMSAEGQEVLGDVVEAWVIEHATKYHLVRHVSGTEMVS